MAETHIPPSIIAAPGAAYLIRLDAIERPGFPATPPEILPLRVHPTLREIGRVIGRAHWPVDVPDFAEDVESAATTAEWLTYRGAALLAHLALNKEPSADVARLLRLSPSGHPQEPTDLTALTDCLPHLSRLLLVPLSGRVRAAMRSDAVTTVHDVVTTLALDALPEPEPEQDAAQAATEAQRIAIAGALSGGWYTREELRVPLAAAYAVVATVRDWIDAADHNVLQAGPDEMRPLNVFSGPDLPASAAPAIPTWARGLVDAPIDVEAWSA